MLRRTGFWPQVEAVACALLDNNRLTFAEVSRILRATGALDSEFASVLSPELSDRLKFLIFRRLASLGRRCLALC